MPIDYFKGYNEGTQRLGEAFDTLYKEKRQERQDALTNQLLQQKIAEGENKRQSLADIQRISGLTEKTPATTRMEEIFTPTSAGPEDQRLSAASDLGGLQPSAIGETTKREIPVPAVNYTPQEKNQLMIQAAIKHGDWDTVKNIGQVVDVTDKIGRQEATQLAWWANQVRDFKRYSKNGEAAKAYGMALAQKIGVDPKTVEGIDFTASDDIMKPDGQGGFISIMTDDEGKQHYMHIASKGQFSEPYETNIGGTKMMVQKNLQTGEIKRVSQDKSTTVVNNMQQLAPGDIDTVASLLAQGKIDAADLSKRGGNAQIAQIYKRAQEINPEFDPRGTKAANAAYQATLSQQEKQRGAVGSFVKNIDAQIGAVNDIFKYLQRTDARGLNIPIRELKTRLIGSGLENKYDMFISEISAESSKLSQSAAQSIAQLPEGSRQKWEKIHDLNLPISEMKLLLEGTKDMGKIRLKSLDDEITDTKKRRRGGSYEQPAPSSKKPLSAY